MTLKTTTAIEKLTTDVEIIKTLLAQLLASKPANDNVVAEAKAAANDNAAAPPPAPLPEICNDMDPRMLAIYSRHSWQQMRRRGEGPPFFRRGSRCLYRWSEVEAWLTSSRVGKKAE